jgi:hypothetical protein
MGKPDSLDQWFVTNGVVAVGPLDFERLAVGVARGRIPESSYVRHHSWKVWRALTEIGNLSASDRDETVQRLATLSEGAEERAANPRSHPPPPLGPGSGAPGRREESPPPPLSSVRPAAVDPVGVLAAAGDMENALLLTLTTSIAAAKADAGVLYRDRAELGAVVAAYAQGIDAEGLLGARLSEDDPSLVAARLGRTVLGEPVLGDAGRYIAGRFAPGLGAPLGVAMVPVNVGGTLVAAIEVARVHRPFRAREIARIEDVVEALTARIVVEGWVDFG